MSEQNDKSKSIPYTGDETIPMMREVALGWVNARADDMCRAHYAGRMLYQALELEQLGAMALESSIEENNNLRAEIATLRAKMAGMVCGTCRGLEEVCSMDSDGDPDAEPDGPLIPCPVCQPAKEVKPQQNR